MKKIVVQLFLVGFFLTSNFAQSGLITAFNSTHSGRSITLTGSRYLNEKNELGLGIRYHMNSLAHSDDQNNAFKKRLYATNAVQHWGLEAYYAHYIFTQWKHIKPFGFYDLQIAYSETRNRMFLFGYYSESTGVLYKEVIDYFGPFTWVEQCVGIGFKANLVKNFYLFQKIGFGTTFILGKDEKRLNTYDNFEWEFGGLIQVGLLYQFARMRE